MPISSSAVRRAGGWRARALVTLSCLLAALAGTWLTGGAQAETSNGGKPLVVEAPISGTIDPVTKEFVESVLAQADELDADAVVFTIDTPGGLSTSMDDIIKDILKEKERPVIGFVTPGGARAASAGAFIMMATDVAAMSPSTTIGSATPIQGNGEDLGKDLRKKVINDAVAKIKELARDHGRDVKFAEDAVRDADNIGAAEAKKRGVVEFIADDLDDLLAQIDGAKTKPKGLIVDTADAEVRHIKEPATLKLLKLLIDPNILFLLFSAGMLGIAFEITHPGTIFPGVMGAICLVVALFGFQVLPINVAGVVLLVIAFALFAGEALVVSHGVLGGGGVVSLFIGGLLLFDRDSPYSISLWLLALVALGFGAFFGVLVRKALAARKAPVLGGSEGLIGAHGVVRRELAPDGTVFVQGELWQASTAEGADPIPVSAHVTVLAKTGLHLVVAPGDDSPERTTPT